MKDYKRKKPFKTREKEAKAILKKYPNLIPIVVEAKDDIKNTLDKSKYLVPAKMDMSEFMFVIRNRIKLKKEQALFMFVNNHIPKMTSNLQHIYDCHKDKDGFLYMSITSENTFGHKTQSDTLPNI